MTYAMPRRPLRYHPSVLACIASGFCLGTVGLLFATATCLGQTVGSWQPGQGVFGEGSSPLATVDPTTGIAHTAVMFAINAARGAAQPSLSLVYSSDAGTRTAGVGWGLNLPSIEAKPLSTPGTALTSAGGYVAPGGRGRYTFDGLPIVPICVVTQSSCSATSAENMPTWTAVNSVGSQIG